MYSLVVSFSSIGVSWVCAWFVVEPHLLCVAVVCFYCVITGHVNVVGGFVSYVGASILSERLSGLRFL